MPSSTKPEPTPGNSLNPHAHAKMSIGEIMYSLVRDSFVGQISYYASHHKLFKHPEEEEGFEVPRRYRRDEETLKALERRRRRLEGKEKIVKRFEEKRESQKKEEEKPVRIQRKPSPTSSADDANCHSLEEEQAIQEAINRIRVEESLERENVPIRIAPVRRSTSSIRQEVISSRRQEHLSASRTSSSSEATLAPNFHGDEQFHPDVEGGNGKAQKVPVGAGYREDEEALGLKDDQDENLVTWYGEDDMENPMNWSPFKKAFTTFCLCLITVSVYMGSSIYSPGTMSAMSYFGVAQVPATLGLTMFVLGYGTGPLILSPMSEIPAVGRTFIYIISLFLFMLLQLPTMFTSSFAGFCIARFFAGFVGSPPLATGGASIGDMYGPKTRPYAMGLWGLAASSGPALGPVISSFAIASGTPSWMNASFQWAFWIMFWLSAGSFLFLAFFLPETSALNILVRRARRLRKLTGNDKLKSQGELDQAEMTGNDIVKMTLVKPFSINFTQPIIFILNLYIAFIYAILYSWFEAFPIAFQQTYGFSAGVSGLPYLGLLVGSIIGYALFVVWQMNYWNPKYDHFESQGKEIPPEYRLQPATVGAFCIPICLFMFGWTVGRTSYWAPIVASGFFGVGTFFLFLGILNYIPDSYPAEAASALAANDFMRSMFGAGMPLAAHGLFVNLKIDWGCSLLGFVSLLFIPIPFALLKYGHKIRQKSSGAAVVKGEERPEPKEKKEKK